MLSHARHQCGDGIELHVTLLAKASQLAVLNSLTPKSDSQSSYKWLIGLILIGVKLACMAWITQGRVTCLKYTRAILFYIHIPFSSSN